MKKTVKLLSLILAILMTALVLFACNNDSSSENKEDKEEEEKYFDLSPEQVYNKASKVKNITVTYTIKGEDYERVMTVSKDSKIAFVKSTYTYDEEGPNEEVNYVDLDNNDLYELEDNKWYYEDNDYAATQIENYVGLTVLESQYGGAFAKDKAFEKDNYDYEDDVFTLKSSVIDDINNNEDEDESTKLLSLNMVRDGNVYTFEAKFEENGWDGVEEITVIVKVDFSSTDLALPENAIEKKYEEFTVNVKDANGNSVSNVEVNIYSGEENYEDWENTDENGKATFELMSGKEYYITLNYWGEVEYELEEKYYFDGKNANITLAEKEKIVYRVTVSGADGTFLKNIDVSLYNSQNDNYVTWENTDENGFASFTFDEEGTYYVQLYGIPDEYKVAEKYYFDNSRTLNIVLEEKDSYKVTVTDSNGDFVENISVTLYNASGQYIVSGDTNSEGLVKLITDESYNYVYVTVRDYQGRECYIIEETYSDFNSSKEMNIVLQLKKATTVKVVNNLGDPIYNVRVFLRKENSSSWDWEDYKYTGTDGIVVFYELDDSISYYVTIDNVPNVYSYEARYDLESDTLTIYLTPKA